MHEAIEFLARINAERRMQQAEQIQAEFRNLADMLEGAVAEFKNHGWSDEQAREIVSTMLCKRSGSTE